MKEAADDQADYQGCFSTKHETCWILKLFSSWRVYGNSGLSLRLRGNTVRIGQVQKEQVEWQSVFYGRWRATSNNNGVK